MACRGPPCRQSTRSMRIANCRLLTISREYLYGAVRTGQVAPARDGGRRVDEVLDAITDFAALVTYDDLTDHATHAAKQRVIDALGCALGAQSAQTAEIGLRLAVPASSPRYAGRLIGSRDRVSAGSAAFVNGCLIRDLDFNDTYPGGHPSDGIGALLAVAGAVGASGEEFLTSVVVSYEIFIRLQMAGKLREKGWDNGFGIGVGVAAGTARLLGLDRERLRHAIALTATANVPLRATRAGTLSMWKGAATAFATEAAVRATQLAAEGMTGPSSCGACLATPPWFRPGSRRTGRPGTRAAASPPSGTHAHARPPITACRTSSRGPCGTAPSDRRPSPTTPSPTHSSGR
jgi:hypothetical protein